MTIASIRLNDSNAVDLWENVEDMDYSVHFMVNRKFGFKVFADLESAQKFFEECKKNILDNAS